MKDSIIFGYALPIFKFLVVLVLGLIFVNLVSRFVKKRMESSKIPLMVRGSLKNLITLFLYVALFITLASMLGVPTTTFIAIFSTVSLAIGFALKENLSNFASGLIILVLRPLEIGDFVEPEGCSFVGTVVEIQLFYSTLHTADNKKIIVPNNELINNPLINHSALGFRRLDISLGLSKETDFENAKKLVLAYLKTKKEVINDNQRNTLIGIKNSNDLGYVLDIKVWCKWEDYLELNYTLQENIKVQLESKGIILSAPYREYKIVK